MMLGIVIRADGSVPMDADVPEGHEVAMIEALVEAGHDVRWNTDDGYRIDGWQPPTP